MASEMTKEDMKKCLISLKSYQELNPEINNLVFPKSLLGLTLYDCRKNITNKIYIFIKDYYDIHSKIQDYLKKNLADIIEELFMEYLIKCKNDINKNDIKILLGVFFSTILFNQELIDKFSSEEKYLYTLLRLMSRLDYKYETNYVIPSIMMQKDTNIIKYKYLLVVNDLFYNIKNIKSMVEIKKKDEELEKLKAEIKKKDEELEKLKNEATIMEVERKNKKQKTTVRFV
jgi:hypothetical protein